MGTAVLLKREVDGPIDDWFRFSLFRRMTVWVGSGWLPVGIHLRGFGFEFQAAIGWRGGAVGFLGYLVRLLGWDVVFRWEWWVNLKG